MIDYLDSADEKITLYENEISYRMVSNLIKYTGLIDIKRNYENMG